MIGQKKDGSSSLRNSLISKANGVEFHLAFNKVDTVLNFARSSAVVSFSFTPKTNKNKRDNHFIVIFKFYVPPAPSKSCGHQSRFLTVCFVFCHSTYSSGRLWHYNWVLQPKGYDCTMRKNEVLVNWVAKTDLELHSTDYVAAADRLTTYQLIFNQLRKLCVLLINEDRYNYNCNGLSCDNFAQFIKPICVISELKELLFILLESLPVDVLLC